LHPNQPANQGSESNTPALFSLHWELKTLLYLGVLLLSGGLGILIYENIDSISHQAILAAVALVSAGSFYYCYKQSSAFSWKKVKSPTPLYDYLLLLGCLTFITFIGYLQFAYTAFGSRYGLATAIPLVVIFFSAYYFVVLIGAGLKKKDVILLRSGLLFVAAAVLTVRYFYSVMPPAPAMIIADIVLIGVSWVLIRYLKVPRNGMTYEPVADSSAFEALNNVGGLVISQTFGGSQSPQSTTHVDFGGGSGGGGGATGNY
jgi:hypothetical protein